ncbi:MAG TPA: FliM/FliN family flagellar motor switch protein [Spirochaetia bacterium]|nr:FliM/FliN family flagellar motor switch protein [Spirochaetia bacterium]
MKLGYVRDVMVPLQVVLGGTRQTLHQLAEIGEGTIIELDRLAGEPVDLVAAGEVIARGEVVVIDESFGIRVTQLLEKGPGV